MQLAMCCHYYQSKVHLQDRVSLYAQTQSSAQVSTGDTRGVQEDRVRGSSDERSTIGREDEGPADVLLALDLAMADVELTQCTSFNYISFSFV